MYFFSQKAAELSMQKIEEAALTEKFERTALETTIEPNIYTVAKVPLDDGLLTTELRLKKAATIYSPRNVPTPVPSVPSPRVGRFIANSHQKSNSPTGVPASSSRGRSRTRSPQHQSKCSPSRQSRPSPSKDDSIDSTSTAQLLVSKHNLSPCQRVAVDIIKDVRCKTKSMNAPKSPLTKVELELLNRLLLSYFYVLSYFQRLTDSIVCMCNPVHLRDPCCHHASDSQCHREVDRKQNNTFKIHYWKARASDYQ
jgi:hypothetical protein